MKKLKPIFLIKIFIKHPEYYEKKKQMGKV